MKPLTLSWWTFGLFLLVLASNFGWWIWHTQTVNEYKRTLTVKYSPQQAIQLCLDQGHLFHSWPDRYGIPHVDCKLKNPGPIFKTYREYKKYVRELETAMGGE